MTTTTQEKPFALGTISHGTLRPQDIADSIIDHFDMAKDDSEWGGEIYNAMKATKESEDPDFEAWVELCEKFENVLYEHDRFPAFCYFGTTEGDGSDLGIWVDWDSLDSACEDGEILKVSDMSEVAETHGYEYSGHVLHVNDHGNATLYIVQGDDTREVWGVV